MSYATVDELKAALDKASTTDDDVLQLWLDAASQFIDQFTRRTFAVGSAGESRTFDIGGGSLQELPDYTAITAVTLRLTTGETPVALAATDYFLWPTYRRPGWPYQGLRLSPVGDYPTFPTAIAGLAVTGTWGWPAVPDDLRGVCISMAARGWKAAQAGFNDVVGVTETGAPIFSKQLTSLDRLVLDRYRGTVIF
jgi:hypothetical protein